jgi:hypothetical protein
MAPRVKKTGMTAPPGASASSTPHVTKQSKFNIAAAAKRAKVDAVPKAATIAVNPSGTRLLPPPALLDEKIGSPMLVVAIDIETHDWEDNQKASPRLGPFGWFTLREEPVMAYARIVEIAWLIGAADPSSPPAPPRSQLVQPIDFMISAKATDKSHHITNDEAHAKGVPLAAALSEFMKDVADAVSRGGRIVSHHLDFVAPMHLHVPTPAPPTHIHFWGPLGHTVTGYIDNDRSSTQALSHTNCNALAWASGARLGKRSPSRDSAP